MFRKYSDRAWLPLDWHASGGRLDVKGGQGGEARLLLSVVYSLS
jgi:hypothetical protein